jgi:hypothetical protein
MSETFEKKWKMLQSHLVKQTPGIHLSILDHNVGVQLWKLGHNTVKMVSFPLHMVCVPNGNLVPLPWGVPANLTIMV